MSQGRRDGSLPRPGGSHIPELDGIRGVAVLAVMMFHQTVFQPVTWLDRQYLRLAAQFGSGVDLFFVLSGFLITGILYDARASAHYYRNFYARRSLRIIPLYYALLFLALVVLPLFPHPKLAKWAATRGLGQLPYWLFLSNWSIALSGRGPQHGMIDLSWTLSIEEQFYLTWPLVVRAMTRRRLMAICLGLAATSLGLRCALTLAGIEPRYWAMLTPCRLDGLALGAWAALAARGEAGLAPLMKPSRWVAGITAILAAVMVFAPTAGGPEAGLLGAAFPAVLAVGFTGIVLLAAGGPPGSPLRRLFRWRFLTTFGVFSYALYLFHNPIAAVVRDTVFPPSRFPTFLGSPLPGQFLFYVIASIPALIAAWVSWHVYEKPWLSLKRFFPASERPAPSPPAVPAPAAGLDVAGAGR